MKKIVSAFAFALVLGGLTFADDMAPAVKIGAWGRGVFIPVISGGANNMTALGVSWGGPVRTGITVSGTSESVGFQVDMNVDNPGPSGAASLGDQQKIWVKPVSGLTLQIGQAFDDTLRGNTSFGSWDWIRLGPISDEDNVFSRVNTANGFEASYAVDALYVYGAFRGLAAPVLTNDVALKTLQLGAGYTIKDVGLIRAQAIGVHAAKDYNVIEAAFRLTAVQSLYADVGIKYPTDKTTAGYSMLLNAYANYTVDKAKIHGLLTYSTPATGSDAFMGVGAGLDYSMDGGLGLGADVRYYSLKSGFGYTVAAGPPPVITGSPKDSLVTFFAGLTKGFSNGVVGIGIEYATLGGSMGGTTVPSWGTLNYGADPTKAQILVPVKLEYWF